jgi:hypothetical protein
MSTLNALLVGSGLLVAGLVACSPAAPAPPSSSTAAAPASTPTPRPFATPVPTLDAQAARAVDARELASHREDYFGKNIKLTGKVLNPTRAAADHVQATFVAQPTTDRTDFAFRLSVFDHLVQSRDGELQPGCYLVHARVGSPSTPSASLPLYVYAYTKSGADPSDPRGGCLPLG